MKSLTVLVAVLLLSGCDLNDLNARQPIDPFCHDFAVAALGALSNCDDGSFPCIAGRADGAAKPGEDEGKYYGIVQRAAALNCPSLPVYKYTFPGWHQDARGTWHYTQQPATPDQTKHKLDPTG